MRIQFLPDQEEILSELREMAESNEEDEETMDAKVLKVSALLIMHSDYAPRKSALVHFFGVLGYDARTKRWREPNTYTPILAGVQFCMRVLMLEYALPSEERNELICMEGDDPLEVFRGVRDKWLVDGEASPFNVMHKLLQYGMRVGMAMGGRDRVLWSEDGETMYFDGRPLGVEGFRGFIHSTIEAAERLLCEDLLFGDTERLGTVDLWKLRDDVNVPNVKHSFISVEENGLSGGRERMMKLLKRSNKWKKMLRKGREVLDWIGSGIRDYEWAVGKFLEYLLILIHITGGQPGRGTEITTLRYANAMQTIRNIFVKEGRVMIVTEYHKSMAVTDQVKVIPRFLPERVGKLLVVYLADVLPFRQLMDRKAGMLTSKGFLWFKKDKPWETDDLTKALTTESGSRMGFHITTADYRHIAIAIDRRHVRGLTDGMDPDEEDAHDLQATHSTTTADKVYGIRGDILKCLSDHSIRTFERVTDRWHSFLRLISKAENDGKVRQRALSMTASMKPAKRIKQDMGTEMQEALEGFLGKGAKFRSKEQRLGLKGVLEGESPLVVILTTGGGKSLLFMLPAWLEGA